MTTVITRYFDDAADAWQTKQELWGLRRFPLEILTLHEKAEGLAKTLTAAKVDPDTAKAYEEKMAADGGAVLAVLAGYRPLGVAKITREVTAAMGAADMGDLVEEVSYKDAHKPMLSIAPGHPRMMTRLREGDNSNYHMANWPISLISRRKPFSGAVISRHGRMADILLPLLSRRTPYTDTIFLDKHPRMADWPMRLLSDRKPYTGSMISKHGRMANFPLPLLSRRVPRNRTVIGKHTRMANWPFPHLMNGQPSTNALIPGGPRMANFPISLLSQRKPNTASIFSRHARMANFPIGLLSRRKPNTASIFSRHARMANFILPLTTKGPTGGGFSISRMLGLSLVSSGG